MTMLGGVLLLLTLLGTVEAALRTQDGPMPLPARAHCRVFVVASRTHTRLLVLQNAYEQDGINVYEQDPALASVLQDTASDHPADAKDEKNKANEAYQILRPAFEKAAEWLKLREDPALCFAHFIVTESETTSGTRTQNETRTSRVTRRLDQLKDRARSDSSFPFGLPTRSQDGDNIASSGDLRIVTSIWRRYFQLLGTNYFSGRVAPSLSPGQMEVFGLLHVDAGGQTGQLTSESDSNSAEMIFDVRERWRRSKRQRQVNVALNTSDFYGRTYAGFGRHQVLQTVIKLNQKKDKLSGALQHPCFLRDYSFVLTSGNETLKGTGDADKCLTLIRSHVALSNANCPPENFCFLNSVPQPQGSGSFYASGVLREAVLSATRVLEDISNKPDERGMELLQLPTPALSTIRDTAKTLCSLPYMDVLAGAKSSQTFSSQAAMMEEGMDPTSTLCFDLCYTVVLLEQIGVQDADERVHFVENFEKQLTLSRNSLELVKKRESPPELVAWLTGAFLYLEALQRKVTFSIESELLAEQLSAGLPLGWNMSLLLFVAACCFLYFTTGRTDATQSSSGYRHVINGGSKTKYKDTTQSIMFVDDARE